MIRSSKRIVFGVGGSSSYHRPVFVIVGNKEYYHGWQLGCESARLFEHLSGRVAGIATGPTRPDQFRRGDVATATRAGAGATGRESGALAIPSSEHDGDAPGREQGEPSGHRGQV